MRPRGLRVPVVKVSHIILDIIIIMLEQQHCECTYLRAKCFQCHSRLSLRGRGERRRKFELEDACGHQSVHGRHNEAGQDVRLQQHIEAIDEKRDRHRLAPERPEADCRRVLCSSRAAIRNQEGAGHSHERLKSGTRVEYPRGGKGVEATLGRETCT